MNYIKKSILLCILTIGLYPGCANVDCESENIPQYFDIFGLDVRHTTGDAFSFQFIENGSTVLYANYRGIHLNVNATFYGQVEEKRNPFLSFGMGAKLLACVPPSAGYNGSETESLGDIQVTTLFDFDENHPAESDITDLMKVRLFDVVMDLDEFLSSKKNELIQIEDLPYVLFPEKAPTADESFKVRVKITIDPGEEYTAESPTILLQP